MKPAFLFVPALCLVSFFFFSRLAEAGGGHIDSPREILPCAGEVNPKICPNAQTPPPEPPPSAPFN
jgi:hypothetical protein